MRLSTRTINNTGRRSELLRCACYVLLQVGFVMPLPTLLSQESVALPIPDLQAIEARFKQIADQVRSSVVAIHTEVDDAEGRPWQRATGHGSGLVISAEGLVLTNEHVVADARTIKAVLSTGAEYEAKVIAADPRRDLAVIKIEAADLRPVTYAEPDAVRVGQWALALGNPYGLANSDGQPSLTVGVVSATGRNLTNWLEGAAEEDRFYGNLIQTSTGINPGNSGGPLFDLEGRVIGIIVAVAIRPDVAQSFGFATPVTRQVRTIIDTLSQGKSVEYGMIGATVGDLSQADMAALSFASRKGARVAGEPFEGSAAAAAGLKIDDIILEFDGTLIESADHLVDVVGATPVGTTVPVRYVRGGMTQTVPITVTRRNTTLTSAKEPGEEDLASEGMFQWGGAIFKPLAVKIEKGSELSSSRSGLLVVKVRRDSAVYDAGLRDRDKDGVAEAVAKVNGRRVADVEEFRRAVRRNPNRVTLELVSGNQLIVQF